MPVSAKPLILIVDDQKEDRASLSVILANEGYPFIEASTAKEALEKVRDNASASFGPGSMAGTFAFRFRA